MPKRNKRHTQTLCRSARAPRRHEKRRAAVRKKTTASDGAGECPPCTERKVNTWRPD
ncbi:hypothetical protein TF3313_2463 [Tannerella forsythia 3313]|nr:hypothetical protein TF3313_2463 [Tannerella forsythia 3313]